MNMVRLWGAVFVTIALVQPVFASEVTVSFVLPAAAKDMAATWSATPTNLPEEADILSAMVMEDEPRVGEWQVALEPGPYMISAFTDVDVYELNLDITDQDQGKVIEIPAIDYTQQIPYRCEGPAPCAYEDADTGLSFTLPAGWSSEQPYFPEIGRGELSADVSAVFFEHVEGDGGSVWFLNPIDWHDEEMGPCVDVDLGVMCTFEQSQGSEAAFSVIVPSLVQGAGAP